VNVSWGNGQDAVGPHRAARKYKASIAANVGLHFKIIRGRECLSPSQNYYSSLVSEISPEFRPLSFPNYPLPKAPTIS
jgi:hypothetical protein